MSVPQRTTSPLDGNTKHALIAVVVALLAFPLFARVTATVRYQGEVIAGAEMCFYPSASADPFAGMLGAEFHCYPADTTQDIPNGTFGVFARRAPDLVGAHHPLVFGSEEPMLGTATVGLSLVPAAHLDLRRVAPRLGPEEHVALYIGETSRNRPAVMPLGRPDAPVAVPARTPLVPLLVRKGMPVAVGHRLELEAGEVAPIDFDGIRDGATVLLRLRAEDPTPEPVDASGRTMPYSMQFLKLLSESSVPRVEILDSSGSRQDSETQAINSSNLFESLYIFRNVPAGPATIIVSGRHWQTTTSAIELSAEGVFAPEPVLLVLGAGLQLTVEVPLISREGECGSSLEGPAAFPEVTLYDCGDSFSSVRPSRGSLSQCTVLVSRHLEEPGAAAEVGFSGLAPGEYVLATALGERVTNIDRVTLEGGRTSILQMPFASHFVAGRVTRDGRGVPANVRFLTGSAVTDPETGEYYALLSGAPGTAVLHVVGCDESFVYMHRPVAEVPHGPGYDLYLPPNKLLIDVIDDSTRAVLPEASVMVAMVRADDPTVQIGAVPAFADGDRFRVENLDEGIQVVTCADLTGYRRGCSEPITIRKRTEEVTLRLAPLGKKGIVRGRGYSTVYWVRPDGTVSERAPIDDQGEFHYSADHEVDHLVLVGSAPLWVTRAPLEAAQQERLELHPPEGVERSIRFRMGEANPRQTATVLLWVNGLPVPIPALSQHQRYRGQPWLIVDRRAMLVSGLFGSDALAVAEGPDPDTYPGFFDPHAAIFAGRQPHQVRGAEFVFD